MKVYLGTCGPRVRLSQYVTLFNALEINATFYRFPSGRSLKNWQKALRDLPDFGLSLKVYQGLTHPPHLPTWKRSGLTPEERKALQGKVGCLKLTSETQAFWQQTLALAQTLKARFLLFQAPAACQKEGLEEAFWEWALPLKPPHCSWGLEIRWEEPKLLDRLWQRYQVVPVFDPLLFPALFERFKDLPRLYFRLHGGLKGGRLDYRKRYSEEELTLLAQKIKGLRSQEVWILFNNVYMHEDALSFKEILALIFKEDPLELELNF